MILLSTYRHPFQIHLLYKFFKFLHATERSWWVVNKSVYRNQRFARFAFTYYECIWFWCMSILGIHNRWKYNRPLRGKIIFPYPIVLYFYIRASWRLKIATLYLPFTLECISRILYHESQGINGYTLKKGNPTKALIYIQLLISLQIATCYNLEFIAPIGTIDK